MEVVALFGFLAGILKKVPGVFMFWRGEQRADAQEGREAVKAVWDGFEKRIELAESNGDEPKAAELRDEYSSHIEAWQKERNWALKEFAGFQPQSQESAPGNALPDDEDSVRIRIYQKQQGFFLTHSWRASSEEGQVADIVISLYHHPDGVIPDGRVKQVTYELGRKFFPGPVVQTNADENFRLELSAYDSMLCLARVEFTDETAPLELHRYINFPADELLQEMEWEQMAYDEDRAASMFER